MAYKEIIRLFDERKRKLGALLDDDCVQLKDERAQQIRGAMDEIELFLLTLHQYQDRRLQRNFSPTAELPDAKKGFFSRVFKGKQSSRNFALSEQVSGKTQGA